MLFSDRRNLVQQKYSDFLLNYGSRHRILENHIPIRNRRHEIESYSNRQVALRNVEFSVSNLSFSLSFGCVACVGVSAPSARFFHLLRRFGKYHMVQLRDDLRPLSLSHPFPLKAS